MNLIMDHFEISEYGKRVEFSFCLMIIKVLSLNSTSFLSCDVNK